MTNVGGPRQPRSLFFGRERELERSHAVLQRSAALVIWGLGGLGKSALARVLADAAGVLPERALFIEAMPGMTLAELASRASAGTASPRRWPASRLQGDAAVARLVGLLEPDGGWLIVDDAHRMGELVGKELFQQFVARAEAARLVMTSRLRLATPDSIDAHVQVGPLPVHDLHDLLARLRPELDAQVVAELAAMSGGSPLVARSLAAAATSSAAATRETIGAALRSCSILEDLGEDGRRAVELLRWSRSVVSMPTLERLLRAEVLGALEARSIIERTGRGVRLHDFAKEQLALEQAADIGRGRELAEALSQSREPWEVVEAIASWATLGDLDRAVALAEEQGAKILREVDPNETFRALRSCPPFVALRLRLRCAFRSGDAEAMAWAEQQEPMTDGRARVVWLEIVAARGRRDEACAGLAMMGPLQQDIVVDVSLARCRLARTRAEALDALGQLPELEDPSAMFLASRTRALVFAGRVYEALRTFHHARIALARVTLEDDPEAASLLFALSAYLGKYREAEELAEEQPWLTSASTASGADLYVLALLATERGTVKRATELIDAVTQRTGNQIIWRFLGNYLRARLAVTIGRFAEAQAAISLLFDDASVSRRPDFHAWARIAHLRCCAARGVDAALAPWPSELDLPGGPEGQLLECATRIEALRRGGGATREGIDSDGAPLVRQMVCMLDAWIAWTSGAPNDALSKADEALAHARTNGAVVEELDIAEQCIRWLTDPSGSQRLRDLANRVHELATSVGSPRFVSLAERVLSGGPPADAPLHAFIDRRGSTVHLSDGRAVSLAKHPLGLRLLEVLVESGGVASKERLAREVWRVRAYLPSRDDKRIQVMVRRLRTLLERDPSAPAILHTVTDGYSLRQHR